MSEFEQLIEDYLNGDLQPADAPRLRAWLAADESRLAAFVRRCHLQGAMREELRGIAALQAFTAKQEAANVSLGERWRRRWKYLARTLSTPPSISVIVAALVIGLMITAMAFMMPPFYRRWTYVPPSAELPHLVAHVSRLQEAQWAAGQGSLRRGSHLMSGQQLVLTAGLAEIQFVNGPTMILDGPAEIVLLDDGRARLNAGKITGLVHQAKQQLKVETKLASVVDLGTQFGVDVDLQRGVSVYVMRGSVKVVPNSSGAHEIVLRQGEAWSSGAEQSNPPVADKLREQFAWTLNVASESDPQDLIARYEELRTRGDVVAHYDFEPDSAAPGRLRNRALTSTKFDGKIGAPWTTGHGAQATALDFTGSESHVVVALPDAYESLTLMASLRIAGHGRFQGVLMSDGWDEPGKLHWQIASGRMQLALCDEPDSFSSYVMPLDTWVRPAVVIDARQRLLTHYINGEFAGSSKMENPPQIVIGSARIGSWNDRGQSERNLLGQIDELLILKRALSAGEIRHLDEIMETQGRREVAAD